MARKRPPNKVHTSPERAGIQNMKGVKMEKDEMGLMKHLINMREHGKESKQAYKGLWDIESLTHEIDMFFIYCGENDFKPTIPALVTWLGISKSQFNDWRAKQDRYGDKSAVINEACTIMETYLQSNIDKYPTGSIFLLKTSHGHAETSKIEVTSKGVGEDEIADKIKKMGLEKDKGEE